MPEKLRVGSATHMGLPLFTTLIAQQVLRVAEHLGLGGERAPGPTSRRWRRWRACRRGRPDHKNTLVPFSRGGSRVLMALFCVGCPAWAGFVFLGVPDLDRWP